MLQKILIDERHRIVIDKYNYARPQWKGAIFWHNYVSYNVDMWMGAMVFYKKHLDPVGYYIREDAEKFIKEAIEQENKEGHLGKYYEPCNELMEENYKKENNV